MTPKNNVSGQGYEDWEITAMLSKALGYEMHYKHTSDIMDEIAALTPTFKGVSFKKLDELGSIQWPCNDEYPTGTPTMHIDVFVRGKGKFFITQYVPTTEKVNAKYPLILTTGRILSQYNVGAQTRRTKNVAWHHEDVVEIHPHDAQERGIKEGDWIGIVSRAGETVLRATLTERVQPGIIYTTFHHPQSGANVITTDNSDWATNCPEFKVTAVQLTRVNQLSDWQLHYKTFSEAQLAFAGRDLEAAKID
jgi:formate dehydrogenase major subunit